MFNVWHNWDESFYDIPKIYDILVLFPYKEITKTLNSIFSKTTQRNFKIFRDSFQVNLYHFMPKKWEVKLWTQNFQFTWQFLVCYAFKKLWEVVPIKLCFWNLGNLHSSKRTISWTPWGQKAYNLFSWDLGKNS